MERSFETITESLVSLSNSSPPSSSQFSSPSQTRFSLLLVLSAITSSVVVWSWYTLRDPFLLCEEGLKTWAKVVSGCEAVMGVVGVVQFVGKQRTARAVCLMAAIGIPGDFAEFTADLFGIALLHSSSVCSPAFWHFSLLLLVLSLCRLWLHAVYCSLLLFHHCDVLCAALPAVCSLLPSECSVCSLSFDGNSSVVSFDCRRRHLFHAECVRTADGRDDGTCPICNGDV